jgi:hypothetical protein
VIDLTELERLSLAIAASSAVIREEGEAVVSRGALNIKNAWRDNATQTAGAHARLYPATISYDLHPAGMLIEAEVGPDKAKPQGPLGNILEFGTSSQAGHNDGGRALDAEEPRFLAQAEALAERAVQL